MPQKPTESRALQITRQDAWLHVKAMVLDGLSSEHSRRAYGHSLDHFQQWSADHATAFDRATVQRYRASLEKSGLGSSTINVRISAVRKLAAEAADNGLLAPEIAAAIGRVKGAKRHGTRTGNWLSRSQAQEMLGLRTEPRTKGSGTKPCCAC
jgi:site-specific recombinase XerD